MFYSLFRDKWLNIKNKFTNSWLSIEGVLWWWQAPLPDSYRRRKGIPSHWDFPSEILTLLRGVSFVFLWPFPISILDSCYIRINPLSLSIYQSKPVGMNVPPTKCGRFECRRKKRVRRVGRWWSFIPFVTLLIMIISLLSCWWWSSYLCYLVDDEWWIMMPLLKENWFPKPERVGRCLLWSGETSQWLCLPTEEKSKQM